MILTIVSRRFCMKEDIVKLHWPSIVERAAAIVESYDTGVTLRQLFYRLVATEILPNTTNSYKALSKYTAQARRDGGFPPMIDRGRTIHRYQTFASPLAARRWLSLIYRLDRTAGQEYTVYLGVEKNGIVNQLQSWFGDLGVPILALGGYSSQTYVDEVREDSDRSKRPSILIYAGDFDPSGEDIDRDFVLRTNCFAKVVRVALSPELVELHNLPPQPGKESDARAGGFIARHGELVQVELDALPPDVLRDLYQEAIATYWDSATYDAVVAAEDVHRRELRAG